MRKSYIIDTHTHIGYRPKLSVCESNLVESERDFGTNFVLFSYDGSEFFKDRDIGRYTPMKLVLKHSLTFLRKNSGYGMLIWVQPYGHKDIATIDKFIAKNREKVYGIKFHPACSHVRIDSKKAAPFIELAKKWNLPILVHTAMDKYSSIIYLKVACERYPDVNFIAAHMELGTDHLYTIDALKKYHNLFCDTAWVDARTVKRLEKEGLADRVMFGTDNPIDGIDTLNEDIYQNLKKNRMKLKRADYEALMYKNALRIYKIPETKLIK
jgi:predicted TIM-barrel fold metal-dependent hydrolase